MSTNIKAIFKDKKIDIDWKVYPEDLTIYINKADFFSIFLNLLTNSVKAVSINSKQKDRKILISIYRESYDLKMLFSNNGPTIEEDEKTEIFKMFITRYDEGTGLGLPIVKEIIEEYKGKIFVSNQPEFEPGATFEITIPLEMLKR